MIHFDNIFKVHETTIHNESKEATVSLAFLYYPIRKEREENPGRRYRIPGIDSRMWRDWEKAEMIAVATRMLQIGNYEIEEISKISGLSMEQVLEVKKEKNL